MFGDGKFTLIQVELIIRRWKVTASAEKVETFVNLL